LSLRTVKISFSLHHSKKADSHSEDKASYTNVNARTERLNCFPVILRLGGFHTMSCFIASIGKLWGDGGLKDLLIESSVYAESLLTGEYEFVKACKR
jgi:hypothetical protein